MLADLVSGLRLPVRVGIGGDLAQSLFLLGSAFSNGKVSRRSLSGKVGDLCLQILNHLAGAFFLSLRGLHDFPRTVNLKVELRNNAGVLSGLEQSCLELLIHYLEVLLQLFVLLLVGTHGLGVSRSTLKGSVGHLFFLFSKFKLYENSFAPTI